VVAGEDGCDFEGAELGQLGMDLHQESCLRIELLELVIGQGQGGDGHGFQFGDQLSSRQRQLVEIGYYRLAAGGDDLGLESLGEDHAGEMPNHVARLLLDEQGASITSPSVAYLALIIANSSGV
jgi:hypothetical protein